MKFSQAFARLVLAAGILAAAGRSLYLWAQPSLIHARLPENGGWNPDELHAKVGKPLVLHLTSDDVAHSFAVEGLAMQSVDVLPGKVTDVTLQFERPGTYVFYSTSGPGTNALSIIGTIQVTGTGSPVSTPGPPPLYMLLGLDLDALHNSPRVPDKMPSAMLAQSGEVPIFPILQPSNLPIYESQDFYRSHSPYATWLILRENPLLSNMDNQQIWNMVAFVWESNTTAQAVAHGRKLFAQDCAGCHGETAQGNSIYAAESNAAASSAAPLTAATRRVPVQGPANFTDQTRMLGASPALLQGKILRGGIGTDMPSWGPILTEAQTWDLVAYLYSFQFEYH